MLVKLQDFNDIIVKLLTIIYQSQCMIIKKTYNKMNLSQAWVAD